MRVWVTRLAAAILLVLVAGVALADASRITNISVVGRRVRLGDLVAGLADAAAQQDMGPTPASLRGRTIPRDEVIAALHEHSVAPIPTLPDAFRVYRQQRILDAAEVTRLIIAGMEGKLPRGSALALVKAPPKTSVPEGWTDVRCDSPHPPHRTGRVEAAVTMVLLAGGDPLWTLVVPVELDLSSEAVAFDVAHGAHVDVLLQRGLVELRAAGTVTADGDIGSVVPVIITEASRTLRARLLDARTAIVVDAP
jgi:hypothetical protein